MIKRISIKYKKRSDYGYFEMHELSGLVKWYYRVIVYKKSFFGKVTPLFTYTLEEFEKISYSDKYLYPVSSSILDPYFSNEQKIQKYDILVCHRNFQKFFLGTYDYKQAIKVIKENVKTFH